MGCVRRGFATGRRACLVWLLTALSACAWQEVPSNPPSALPDAAEINAVLRQLSEITGFRVRHQLPFRLMTRDEINSYIQGQIRRSVRPKDIHAEELSLKKLGFVSADFDLKQTTIDLLTEQAAAFYDFHKKKLFISDWAASTMRNEALVHELAHALADQNFNIEKYLSKGPSNADEALARQTVVEGQASWLTLEYAAHQAGKTLADAATARELFRQDLDPDDPQYPVFSKAPLYLRATMLFPYQEGQTFQQAVRLRHGQSGFELLFRKPPVTTSQVLHPDVYFAGTVPVIPELPAPVRGMKAAVRGVFGEEDMRVLLRQYTSVSVARQLAPGLRGGCYRIDQAPNDKNDEHATLVFATEWADEDSAVEFLGAYRKVLTGKWKRVKTFTEDAAHFIGESEVGYFSVIRSGKTVVSREGFADKL